MHDTSNNPSIELIELIEKMVLFGEDAGYDVILEGILRRDLCGEMLRRLVDHFDGSVYACYFDVGIEETLRRHMTKSNAHEFGEAEMRDLVDDGATLKSVGMTFPMKNPAVLRGV